MNKRKEKGLMAMPAVVLFAFTFTIVAIALGLIVAKDVVLTKTYIANETRADTTLYNFLIDNTCSETKITNAEILSIGIMQKKTAEKEIEIKYGGIEKNIKFKDCVETFFENIEFTEDYYFYATDTITNIAVGNINTNGTKTITYIPTITDDKIKITLVI